jgi:toxin ParE1/3/4
MPKVRISVEAEADIGEIAKYTTRTWGLRQTDVYLASLQEGFDLLARNPLIGMRCDSLHSGLRRFGVEKHVVFYLQHTDGILIVRVLHQRMLPAKLQFDALG